MAEMLVDVTVKLKAVLMDQMLVDWKAAMSELWMVLLMASLMVD